MCLLDKKKIEMNSLISENTELYYKKYITIVTQIIHSYVICFLTKKNEIECQKVCFVQVHLLVNHNITCL